MNTAPLIAGWKCICGEEFESGRDAFLHRDGTDFHQVSPSVSRMSGIEKQALQTEIQNVGRK
jgi:hypothetical protein